MCFFRFCCNTGSVSRLLKLTQIHETQHRQTFDLPLKWIKPSHSNTSDEYLLHQTGWFSITIEVTGCRQAKQCLKKRQHWSGFCQRSWLTGQPPGSSAGRRTQKLTPTFVTHVLDGHPRRLFCGQKDTKANTHLCHTCSWRSSQTALLQAEGRKS